MNFLSWSAIAAGIALLATTSPQPLRASTGIQRCEQADGTYVYSDRACSAFGALAAPMPGPMMSRLLSTMPAETSHDRAQTAAASGPRRGVAAGCARTPAQLEADLRASFALGDPNRIAESYQWAGLSNTEGQRMMGRIESLSHRPLQDVHYFGLPIASLSNASEEAHAEDSARAALPTRDGGDGSLQLQLGGHGLQVIDLNVTRYADCYFMAF